MTYPAPEELYTPDYFTGIALGSVPAAAVVAPMICDWLHPRRVLDVGCGEGAWLVPFADAGLQVLGVDGPYVDVSRLYIPEECFVAHDLRERLPVAVTGWGADLAICLEVAEHLPPECGPGLVGDLTAAAGTVLFSGAVPGQGGWGHINEMPHDYWIGLFEDEGFAVSRVMQRRLRGNMQVEDFYRNNMLLACRIGRDGRELRF